MKPLYSFSALFLFLFLLTNCNRGPYAETNRTYKKQAKELVKGLRKLPSDSLSTMPWAAGTVNFNLRKPNFVIIHHTAQNSCEQTLKTFTSAQSKVSAHYVICRDGTVHHMLNDYFRAAHAGVGRWGNTTDINSSSIGIELDNNGFEPFPEIQLASLANVLQSLKTTHSIPTSNFIGHSDIAPTRKVDPNVQFPWKPFADMGYGLWWSDTTNMQVPEGFNHLQALRIIGYDIKDPGAAIAAFKRKYLQVDKSKELTPADTKVLFSLYQKFL
ncbi:MAG TPA: N-acetylmuramoyl-L-alanine amidase [Flavisolibacter sp.]|jgi:N-acetylmuramoyl-L-alanine amidase